MSNSRYTHPDSPDQWVEVKPLTIGFRSRWNGAQGDSAIVKLALEVVDSWHLVGHDGAELPQPVACDGQLPEGLYLTSFSFIIEAVRMAIKEQGTLFLAKGLPSPA